MNTDLFFRARQFFRVLLAASAMFALLLGQSSLMAQLATDDPDWKELDAQAPPAFSRENLIALEMPAFLSLKFGIDPTTVTVSTDGIVRYVVVATSGDGAVNVMYEGLRCATGEFKTYARAGASGVWSVAKEPQWRSLNGNYISRHAQALARQGGCDGRVAGAATARGIIQRLKQAANSP